jgi:hypothetical protein
MYLGLFFTPHRILHPASSRQEKDTVRAMEKTPQMDISEQRRFA